MPPEVELKQSLKPDSCGFIAAARCIGARRIAARRTAARLTTACLTAACLTAACLAAVFCCLGAWAKSDGKGGESAQREKVATAAGNSPSQTLKMAQFHTTRREFKEAIVLWIKLAELKPDAFAEANLGWSYLQLGEKQKAEEHINRSIQLNPRTIEGYRYLGYFLMGEGKVPDAVKAFRTSMSFDPHHKCNCGDLEKLVLSKSKNRKP